jgi:hypothetical protein
MHYFSTLFGKERYLFRRDLLSIIRIVDTVFTAIGIFILVTLIVCYRGQDDLEGQDDLDSRQST